MSKSVQIDPKEYLNPSSAPAQTAGLARTRGCPSGILCVGEHGSSAGKQTAGPESPLSITGKAVIIVRVRPALTVSTVLG